MDNNLISNQDAMKVFLLDVNCLDKLKPWISKVNLFDVLKVSRTEIRHSNILAWLLDANENHGLDDLFVRAVIHRIVDDNAIYFNTKRINVLSLLTIDYSHFIIYREWNNIDLLLVSQEDKIVIAIENKIGTGEHDNQLKRYQHTIETKYPITEGYDYIYIYLTPDNNTPSDVDNWIAFSYVSILRILVDIRESTDIDRKVLIIIDDYIETLRRFVV